MAVVSSLMVFAAQLRIRHQHGTRAYLHAVIDNFSRRILAWRVADTFAPVNSVTVLLDASRTE
jgi:putative transposase